MAKAMKCICVISSLLTVCFFILYQITNCRTLIPFAVTFATAAYHLLVRLLIGSVYDVLMRNRANYRKGWYRVCDFEMRLYQKWKVKAWKNKMPTYDPDTFDVSKHSWEEIVQATCQSELVHETNILFSFLPLLASVWFGSFWAFFVTSLLAAGFDLLFVMIQRFNRTRILQITRKR